MITSRCRHCGAVVRLEPLNLAVDAPIVWVHKMPTEWGQFATGGRVFCTYRPDSPKAEPMEGT